MTLLQGALEDVFSMHFARYGLSAPKFQVLVHLYMAGDYGLIQSEISKKMMVSRANITSLLDRLEKEGLVVRKSDPKDKRVFRVYPTERAVALIHAFLPVHNELIHNMMSPLDANEKECMISLLVKLRQGLDSIQLV